MIGRNTGHRCPRCNAPSPWVVDDCEVCGYQSETSRAWNREGRRQKWRDDTHGCLWFCWDFWWVEGIIYIGVGIGRVVAMIVRSVVSIWT